MNGLFNGKWVLILIQISKQAYLYKEIQEYAPPSTNI